MKEPRKDEKGNWRIFDHECHVRFSHPKWKVIKSNTQHPILKVGFEFRGDTLKLRPDLYFIAQDKDLDGFSFDCICEKIAEPDNFIEYLKTVDHPETLRIDYKKKYYEFLPDKKAENKIMKDQKFTKGPWELIQDEDYHTIHQVWSTDEFPTYIARTCYAHKPNAMLIAASPELLEALQGMILVWDNLSAIFPLLIDEKAYIQAKQVIAKALGE